MAKSRSMFKLQGTFDDLTFVESKAYGEHVRKARSPGPVNAVLNDNTQKIQSANVLAGSIKNIIDLYRKDFQGGQLWQRLVGYFIKELKKNQAVDVSGLRGEEINEHYPLSRIFSETVSTKIDSDKRILWLTINRSTEPNFKRKYIDGYKFSAIGIFPDFEAGTAESDLQDSGVIPIAGNAIDITFCFDLKENWGQYLICLKLEGCSKGEVCSGESVKGMRIVATGKIEEEI